MYVIEKLGYVSATQGFFMCKPYKVKTIVNNTCKYINQVNIII